MDYAALVRVLHCTADALEESEDFDRGSLCAAARFVPCGDATWRAFSIDRLGVGRAPRPAVDRYAVHPLHG
jgi:hypothetical protein